MGIDNCPRCVARTATAAPLVRSERWISPAVGWGTEAQKRPPREQRQGV